uniref:Uncharacterized protein n=1 Tax=Aegilops tauschii subsp. strangulata TaxID=200361 RepID=A0A453RSG2_AEGTS
MLRHTINANIDNPRSAQIRVSPIARLGVTSVFLEVPCHFYLEQRPHLSPYSSHHFLNAFFVDVAYLLAIVEADCLRRCDCFVR